MIIKDLNHFNNRLQSLLRTVEDKERKGGEGFLSSGYFGP